MYYQDYWGGWEQQVRAKVPDVAQPDLLSAFKRLARAYKITLAKHENRRTAIPYTGEESDSDFFLTERFSADITDEGKTYLEMARKPGGRIGFAP